MSKNELQDKWDKQCKKVLNGKKIVDVRYMTDEEADEWGWFSKPLVIFLDDGTQIIPSSDDEGNSAGALFTSIKSLPTIPVIGIGQ